MLRDHWWEILFTGKRIRLAYSHSTTRTATCFILSKVKSCSSTIYSTWMSDQVRIPRVVIPFFFSFLPFLFQGDRTAELPSSCNVVSSFYQLFVPHCAMIVFMCIYLQYRINKPRDTSFEFSSIFSIVDLSKHLITA